MPRVVEHLTLGISSKSSRTRVESIEAMCEILAEEGLAVLLTALVRNHSQQLLRYKTYPYSEKMQAVIVITGFYCVLRLGQLFDITPAMKRGCVLTDGL